MNFWICGRCEVFEGCRVEEFSKFPKLRARSQRTRGPLAAGGEADHGAREHDARGRDHAHHVEARHGRGALHGRALHGHERVDGQRLGVAACDAKSLSKGFLRTDNLKRILPHTFFSKTRGGAPGSVAKVCSMEMRSVVVSPSPRIPPEHTFKPAALTCTCTKVWETRVFIQKAKDIFAAARGAAFAFFENSLKRLCPGRARWSAGGRRRSAS